MDSIFGGVKVASKVRSSLLSVPSETLGGPCRFGSQWKRYAAGRRNGATLSFSPPGALLLGDGGRELDTTEVASSAIEHRLVATGPEGSGWRCASSVQNEIRRRDKAQDPVDHKHCVCQRRRPRRPRHHGHH